MFFHEDRGCDVIDYANIRVTVLSLALIVSKLKNMQTECKYSSTQTVAMKPKAKEIYVLQTKKRYIHANVHLYSENERETSLIHTVVLF